MFPTPSNVPVEGRERIIAALNQSLADGIDLQTQAKEAHWNVRGAQFVPMHELFDKITDAAAEHNDELAERAVILGGVAHGTVRHVAKASKLTDYPSGTTRDMEHAKLLIERIDQHLGGLRTARKTAAEFGDEDTVDLITGIVQDFEKYSWFLRATAG